MMSNVRWALALSLAAGLAVPATVNAQAPCSLSKVMVDSARFELSSVLSSGGAVVQEIRQEQGLTTTPTIDVVRDPNVCTRLATAFGHSVNRGDAFVVLRAGPLYYAREPYQRRGTGVLTDSTFKVVARFGVPIK